MQSQSRILDDLAKLATAATSTLTGVREEVEARVRDQLERVLADMDLVRREEFDAMAAVARTARAQAETLEARVAALEAALAASRTSP